VSEHAAGVSWTRGDAVFTDLKYPRRHTISFDGGVVIPGSSAPQNVRPPLSDPTAVDPEEALMGALASCHMLWFLALAAKQGFVVDRYEGDAVGTMGPNDAGRVAILRAELRPAVTFSGVAVPTAEQVDALHHDAHERCNIANSVRFPVLVSGTFTHVGAA
jgi:organic hydroperoxide reductase OsmC/OhrA